MNDKYWTTSWNPLTVKGGGYHCTKCSEGCAHCWAEGYNRRFGNGIPYDDRPVEFVLDEKVLQQPFHWRKPQVVFVCDLCDLFHEQVPFEFVGTVFGHAHHARRHKYLFLTKRAERMVEFNKWYKAVWLQGFESAWPREYEHIYLGLTICNQAELDEKGPHFLQIPGHTWFSIEPMRGPIVIPPELLRQLDGVIVGGESGPGARPCNLEDVRSVVRQCNAAPVPCFVKQLQINGKLSRDVSEWPEDLRVRQLPWRADR